jgi:peptide/nickel transport system ATP-binding protein
LLEIFLRRRIKIKTHSDEKILDVKGLKKYFPNRKGFFQKIYNYTKAVNGVDFFIKKGETVGLVGESGSGKTTIGRCIVRLFGSTAGTVEFNVDGEMIDLLKVPKKDMQPIRRRFQMIFQDPYSSLNAKMKVSDIVTEPMVIHQIGSSQDRLDAAKHLLEKVGLSANDVTKYPHQFSGGQRQRIGIARALILNPDFVICDEPVSALDVSVQAQTLNLLQDLQEDFNLSYLFIAHDLGVVRYISDRVVVLYLGKVMEVARADEIYKTPKHPYTEALLAAIPKYEAGSDRELLLSGNIPSPEYPPPGCVLNPRCKYKKQICEEVVPLLESVPGIEGAFVACHRYKEINLKGHRAS